jgi:hypothetical protein
MSLIKTLVLAVLANVLTAGAIAATLDINGVKFEDRIAIYNNTLVLNGAGMVGGPKTPHFVVNVYARAPFSTLDELFKAPGPKRVTVTALRDLDTDPIVKVFTRGVNDSATKGDIAKLIPGLGNLENIFRANKVIRKGDVMMLDWVPITGLVIYVGGKVQGLPFKEPEFFRAAMSIWMGETSADTALRDALLGRTKLAR